MDPSILEDRLLMTPRDVDATSRMERLRALGLADRPEPEFDDFAAKIAETTGAPYAMVNLVSDREQYFAGLYTPSNATAGMAMQAASTSTNLIQNRALSLEQGFCPHVVSRGKALVLDDVCDYPRFAGNPVVDQLGIRSYLGAPLVDQTGTAIGTVCAVASEPRPWGRPGLEMIKSMAAELLDRIQLRE